MTAPRGAGLPPRTTKWATYDAWFGAEPRTPAETKQHEQARAAWQQRAQQWHAGQVQYWSDRYRGAMQVANDVQTAMAIGGAGKVGTGSVPLERHVSALDTAEQEIARARDEAHAAVDEINRLSSGDPVTLYQQFLARFPAMATRVAIGDVQP